jgi:hypothetical protein
MNLLESDKATAAQRNLEGDHAQTMAAHEMAESISREANPTSGMTEKASHGEKATKSEPASLECTPIPGFHGPAPSLKAPAETCNPGYVKH